MMSADDLGGHTEDEDQCLKINRSLRTQVSSFQMLIEGERIFKEQGPEIPF